MNEAHESSLCAPRRATRQINVGGVTMGGTVGGANVLA